ncbi:MAG: NAD-dependent epimerase/dehydratase family protein [Deltaproteobacteria bacterium]|nr:NAD-dependent epimerase/dehydratase family protein [Deltaproteobacteria bacterium]MBT4263412.1 NAD-dependent epimerase/dehydratase family protein [Deltaproteobacteria bacterium]MBT4638429.1 NAD-dependent epimerase/dehydratase family protein [Deltaproteobacteria bacterium]MBT6502147.1 NAD-dependent epimerase/dehydratase family protein [Deltaproteobacteria bacterium]MBT6613120.1 NAD-dependent epimerase/dehydratase family protein [Deltaproteobacteria bacterium]
MKVLITGGCGFLGSNLAAEALQHQNAEVIVFDNLFRSGSMNNLNWLQSKGSFKYYHSDIRNSNDIEIVIQETKPDVIFHLAGQVAMTTSISNPRLDFEINAQGTFNLLEAVKKHSPESIIVYSSTNKVYGDLEWVEYEETDTRYVATGFPQGFSEEIRLDFRSPYGCSKGCADQYMLDYYRRFGIRTVVFRHSSMFGSRQFSTFDQGWIGWFCSKAIETKQNKLTEPFTISGNGKQVRDVLYVDDMINLYFSCVEHIEQAQGQVFNIGGGADNSLSLLELFTILESELDIQLDFTRIAPRESDQKVFIADISKAKDLIEWEPMIDKRRGLKNMLSWTNENRSILG